MREASSIRKSGKIRIGILSLGCPKSLVDSEIILGKFDKNRFEIVPTVTDCDIAIVNTCSFIHDAKEESVNHILELIRLKKEGAIQRLIVVGCLVQQFQGELEKELEEVDAFVGSGEYDQIETVTNKVIAGNKVVVIGEPGYLPKKGDSRLYLTPSHYRYLKISEGCDRACSFCTIPLFRGRYQSRDENEILNEAKILAASGAKEIILIGQDTTYYGQEWKNGQSLASLLKKLDAIENIHWIRVLYAYPSCLSEQLINIIKNSRHICHYLDIPLQHISDPILQSMKRGITKQKIIESIRMMRQYIPDIALRTAFIVGYPGETDEHFEELLDFMSEMSFERLGIFIYSQEEGTEASRLPNQVSDDVKTRRFHKAMLLQQEISKRNNAKWLGKSLEVLIESRSENQEDMWIGRSYMDAPEVDGSVLIQASRKLEVGSFYSVQIKDTREYDLVGEIE